MITASGAGAAFIAVPPKRLKPKPKPKVPPPPSSSSSSQSPSSVRRDSSATSSTASRHPLSNTPASPTPSTSSTRSRHVDPALAIESLLTRSRLSTSSHCPTASSGPGSLLEVGIEEDEWTRGFVTGDDFLSSLCQEDPVVSPRPSAYIAAGIKVNSPSGSSTNTIRAASASAAADSPPTDAPVSAASSSGPRKLRRPRPNSHPSSSPSLSAPTEDLIESSKPSTAHHGLGISSWNFGGGKAPRYGERRLCKDSGKMSTVRDINIAVVGAVGVGKTTFIERAYDLPAPARHGDVHSLAMVMDRTPCSVSLVEVDWNRIDFDKEQMQWPRVADGQRIPFIDGVLLLFDPTTPRTVDRLTECLEAFDTAQLPVCLVRTKCDVYGPAAAGVAAIMGDGYDHMQSSVTAHDSQKRCMAAILSLISRRNEKTGSPRYLNGRRRANSSAANSRAASPRPSTGHNRASSEFSSTFLKDGSDAGSIHGARLQRPPTGTALGQSSSNSGPSLLPNPQAVENSRQQNSNSNSNSSSSVAPQITLSSSGQTPFSESVQSPFIMRKTSSQSSLGESERRHSYIDTDDESTDYKDPDDIPILDREDGLDELEEEDKPAPNRGWTWDELVNRLLSQPMSRSDQTFVVIFLCFYRKFASPRELLGAILERFRALDTEEKIRAHRIAAQLRYCNVLHQWVTSHSVDFASSKTRLQMLAFLDSISTDRSLALLTTDMTKKLQGLIEDEDETWGRTDAELDRKASLRSFLTTSSATFPDKPWKLSLDNPATLQVPGSDKRCSDPSDAASVMGSPMGLVISRTESLPPPATGYLRAGCQFELFMSIPVSEVACELTRIDWNEFSKIRPRDLVRHISVSPESRENSPNLACVNNMISHFNHVAHWVASVILEKAKPKHRARALEKFMEIAWTLRHQNNYNSLGAIIAGINGTAVHRLSATRELVRPEIHKNFMRLELLMGTHKSHSKYRLAWENTTSERIPFLPLHRRDLVSAEEGNKTFLQDGEKINWSKFQVMGEVMMVLVKAQASPYKDLVGNSAVDSMIKSAATTMNDDDLYERSVQLEGSAAAGSNKPRRNWFQLKTNIDQR